jgi:hypothetical protein
LEKGNTKKFQIPFRVEANIGIKAYVNDIDSLKLNQWLQQLEVYFKVHEICEDQIIFFARLKLEGHMLTWSENYAIA